MRYSLRTLLLFVTVVCISLFLTRIDFITGSLVLVGIVVISNFLLSKRVWRFAVWGGVLGIVGGFSAMLMYMLIDQGRILGSTYTETGPLIDIVNMWRPYIIQLGALVGATVGLITCRWRTTSEREDQTPNPSQSPPPSSPEPEDTETR